MGDFKLSASLAGHDDDVSPPPWCALLPWGKRVKEFLGTFSLKYGKKLFLTASKGPRRHISVSERAGIRVQRWHSQGMEDDCGTFGNF